MNEGNFRKIERYFTPNDKVNLTGRQYSVNKYGIALAKLETPFVLGAQTNIYLACLANDNGRFSKELLVASYGETSDNGEVAVMRITKNNTDYVFRAGSLWMGHLNELASCIKIINNFNASNEFCMGSKTSSLVEGDMGNQI